MIEFVPQSNIVFNTYDGLENVRNSHVPSNKRDRAFHFDIVNLLPESLREHFVDGMKCVIQRPFDHKYDEAVISMIGVEDNQLVEYRMYVSDPVDENGKAYYTGQGYLPNVVLVKRVAGKWVYVSSDST